MKTEAPDRALALDVVILAAGKGTRMKSERPKVLHRLAGRALLAHVLDTAQALSPRRIVLVVGHGADTVRAAVTELFAPPDAAACEIESVLQSPQLGTGHAVQQALPRLPADGVTLVLSGDVPMIETATLQPLVAAAQGGQLALLTVRLDDPAGYGRIVRQSGPGDDAVLAIVEHKDASAGQRAINECYSGMMAIPNALLHRWLPQLDKHNAQQEYYLTDLVKLAVRDGVSVAGCLIGDALQVAGVNSPEQLAALERAVQLRRARHWLAQGVRLADPARFDLRGRLSCGADVEIDIGCILEGEVVLGDAVRIGAHCLLRNVHIDRGTEIAPFTHVDGGTGLVRIGRDARIGPFARLRAGSALGDEVHIGNFVEVKNSTLATGAKANHLAYLGDAQVGERANYGAGSITANYDGANKHRTIIGADVHVGSNSVLVAPVSIGAGGTVGAGSVVTRDTPEGALTVVRGRMVSVNGWQRPRKGQASKK